MITTTTDGSNDSELEVVEVYADAAGNDHNNLNDEYIVLKNTGAGTSNFSGWSIRYEIDHIYNTPSGFTLASGERVTVYSGSGSNTETELYWKANSAIWNNGSDTTIVTNDTGEQILRKKYSE